MPVRAATAADLHATSDGEPLYHAFGFTTHYPGLSWKPGAR
ncbi:hypothetical protein ABZ297_29215 [Nonomuraea sp. NPDC005983]